MFEQWPNPGAALGVCVLNGEIAIVNRKERKSAVREDAREAKGKSRKSDTEAEGLAWCLALHRKIQRKRRGQEVRRADHR